MARKPNYDFEKRRKETERRAKKDAKREDRLRRKREGTPDESEELTLPVDDGAQAPAPEPPQAD